MARWLPIFAWCSCAISLTLIVLVNLAGTKIVEGQHPALDHILLGGYGPFSVILPFNEVFIDSSSYTLHMYLNAACISPTHIINEEIGPQCLYSGIGRIFNLSNLVDLAAEQVDSGYGVPGYPNATVRNVHMTPLRMTVVPFVFYLMGLVELAILIVSIPLVFCAENFALAFHLALTAGAFMSIMIATAILTAMVNGHIHQLLHNSSAEYIADAKIPPGFLGATWGAACGALFTGVVLLVDWRYEVSLSGRRLRGLVRMRRRTLRGSTGLRREEGNAVHFRELRAQNL